MNLIAYLFQTIHAFAAVGVSQKTQPSMAMNFLRPSQHMVTKSHPLTRNTKQLTARLATRPSLIYRKSWMLSLLLSNLSQRSNC